MLALLPENFAMEVIMRMLRMEAVQKEVLDDVERTLRNEFITTLARTDRRDAHEMMAEIFNSLDRNTENRFITALEERNRESAERIKALMFTFEDLVRSTWRGIQTLLRSVEKDKLPMALKGASDAIKDLFFTNMSERAGKMLREDMDAMGPVRLRDVEEAQSIVVQMAKELAASGRDRHRRRPRRRRAGVLDRWPRSRNTCSTSTSTRAGGRAGGGAGAQDDADAWSPRNRRRRRPIRNSSSRRPSASPSPRATTRRSREAAEVTERRQAEALTAPGRGLRPGAGAHNGRGRDAAPRRGSTRRWPSSRKLHPEMARRHGVEEIAGVVRECLMQIDEAARLTVRVHPDLLDGVRAEAAARRRAKPDSTAGSCSPPTPSWRSAIAGSNGAMAAPTATRRCCGPRSTPSLRARSMACAPRRSGVPPASSNVRQEAK